MTIGQAQPDTLFDAAEVLKEVEAAPRRWKPYPEYATTGYEGIARIPAHWTTERLRFLASLNPVKSEVVSRLPDTQVSFVPMEAVHEFGGLDVEKTRYLEDVYKGYTFFRDGDVIIAKITPCFENGKGSIAANLANGIGFGTTELHVLRPRPCLAREYLFYLTMSVPFRRLGEGSMYGAGGQKRVPESFLANFRTPIPPPEEQEAIAAFLRHETAKIDALVAKKRQLSELLKEKRSALISHAVTKGLDHNASMKPSGIHWLGTVPRSWNIVRIKYLLDAIIDTEHKTVPFVPGGDYLVARTSNVRDGRLVLDGAKFTDEDGYREWTRRGVPQPGDILFTREAPAGEACSVPPGTPLCIGQRMVLFRLRKDVLDSRFGVYSIYSGLANAFIRELSQGSTVAHFNMRDIGSVPMLVPHIDEQRAIADWLDEHTREFDHALEAETRGIKLLSEYRAALVSATVTGQIDVRGEVANGP